MLNYKKTRVIIMSSGVNIKFFGAVDVVVGSYDFYKTKKEADENLISTESATDRLCYNASKIALGAARLTSLGVFTALKLGYIGDGLPNEALDTGLMLMFGATYAVESVMKLSPSLLKTEALNHKRFQTKLLEDNQFFNYYSKETELPLHESYQLFMFGSSLVSSNPVGQYYFSLKNKINDMQADWTEREFDTFNKVQKILHTISMKTPILKDFVQKASLKAQKKREANVVIQEHSNAESSLNKDFMSFMRQSKGDKSRDVETIKTELQEINQSAILEAYKLSRKQNIELFFSKVVADYNFGLKHTDLINKFAELHSQTQVSAKGKEDQILIDSYQKISAMAFKMQKNEKLYPDYVKMETIIKDINPNMIVDNKLKIYSFNDIFEYAKRKIVNAKLLKATDDIYHDVSLSKIGTSIDPNLLTQISKIKNETIRKGESFIHKEKNKI
jgi:hypothetical protein